MTRTSSYRESLLQSLGDPIEAVAYLNAGLEDSIEAFLKALKNVAQAHQMKRVAEAAGVQRESLYRSLSEKGNPTFDTLTGVLSALGMKLSIVPTNETEEEPASPVSPQQETPSQEIQSYPEGIFSVKFYQTYPSKQPDQRFGPLGITIPTHAQDAPIGEYIWSEGGRNNGSVN
jgi:probable addiction module antidote protein